MNELYSQLSVYELRHLPGHLAGADAAEELTLLLTDPEFLESRLPLMTSDEIADDYGLAFPAVRRFRDSIRKVVLKDHNPYTCWTDWELRNLSFHMMRC